MAKKPKTATDLEVKHFSRYGEFLASFELSKYGWDIYTPVYDEYIDLMIHKIVCKSCKQTWNTNPKKVCNQCHKEITSSNKKGIKANGKCLDCGHFFLKQNKQRCVKCNSENIENMPTCPHCKKGIITIEESICSCGSKEHIEKFRTIQVKASRLEKNGTSYAVDLRPKDLTQGLNHFYVWVCLDKEEKPHFLVMSIPDFMKNAKNFLKSTSFLKEDGREHFSAKTFGKWNQYLNRFDLLE